MDQKRRGSLKNSRDQEISELRSRLESQYSRTALVQSQLRATLDTLDEVQAESARVQERYARREKKLIDQLQNYREIARDAQADRDEIRDAAEDVLARVESNYTAPRKLYISSFLEPIVPIVQLSPESDLLNMAASVLNSMRHERDMERTAHEETRTNALAEIAALNARLARRDAELEACVQHKDCSSPVSTSKAEPMSQEEELRVKDIQRARNRELEVEVTSLHNQLDQQVLLASTTAAQKSSKGAAPSTSALPSKPLEKQRSLKRPCSFPEKPSPSSFSELERAVAELGEKVREFRSQRASLLQTIKLQRNRISPVNQPQAQELPQEDLLIPDSGNLLDDDGEMSMELATPLLPVSIHILDPPLIPLPLSPTPSPIPSSSALPLETNMERIQNELSAERQRLDDGEKALVELRAVLEGMMI